MGGSTQEQQAWARARDGVGGVLCSWCVVSEQGPLATATASACTCRLTSFGQAAAHTTMNSVHHNEAPIVLSSSRPGPQKHRHEVCLGRRQICLYLNSQSGVEKASHGVYYTRRRGGPRGWTSSCTCGFGESFTEERMMLNLEG